MANHMTQWKPEVTVDGKTSVANTYRDVKKSMYSLLNDSDSKTATVSRSRRGQWGEWFEHWGMSNSKPVIIKQGWM